MAMRARLGLVAAALLAACSSGLEPQSRVSKLRVLAVRADPPQLVVQPDAGLPATTLSALAVEPSGAPVTMRYALCAVAGGVPSPGLDCPGAQGFDLASTDGGARLDLSDPRFLAFASSFDGGSLDAGDVLANGFPLVVGFEATAPAGRNPEDGGPPPQRGDLQVLSGFTTVLVRTGAPAPENPALAGLRVAEDVDGGQLAEAPADAPLQVKAGATMRFVPVPAQRGDPAVHYGFSFFATDGNISALRSAEVAATGQPMDTSIQWVAPLSPRTVRVWVVVRDGRGGAGWIERTISVR